MTKKVLFVLALALQLFAAPHQFQGIDPLPGCNPCPIAR
jgi:hypothetical protein